MCWKLKVVLQEEQNRMTAAEAAVNDCQVVVGVLMAFAAVKVCLEGQFDWADGRLLDQLIEAKVRMRAPMVDGVVGVRILLDRVYDHDKRAQYRLHLRRLTEGMGTLCPESLTLPLGSRHVTRVPQDALTAEGSQGEFWRKLDDRLLANQVEGDRGDHKLIAMVFNLVAETYGPERPHY